MIGERYWATGIVIAFGVRGWRAVVNFYDDGWCEKGSTEGLLHNRYGEDDLARLVDTVVADATLIGVEWKNPTVLVGDEDGSDLKGEANEQARRLGWRLGYPRVTEEAG